MKKFISLVMCCLVIALPACSQNDAGHETLTLAQQGKSALVIVVAQDAIPAEKTAATQLQTYLQQVTGATFEVKDEVQVSSEAAQILVGAGPRVKSLLPQQDWKSLRHDGVVVKTIGNKLILAGGRPRGALYAVFQFLEDAVGCRWWTATESTIPQRSTLTIEPQDVVYVPPFDYREHFTTQVRTDPVFATKMRENGHFQTQTVQWGGHYNILGWCHTFTSLLPPDKYFKEHPEWYSDPLNNYLPGKASNPIPHHNNTQLCLSNPEVVEELSKVALQWIAKNPEAGYISISQSDSRNTFCQCAACAQLRQREEAQSGPVVYFVNQVAERIGAQYPDFLVETLAYQLTEKPPKTIRPAENVVIRFAPIESDFGHPVNSEWNREVRDNFLGWSKLASKLFVWNYVTNFQTHWLPHPNWSGLGDDLRFFAANKVVGVFEQGDTYSKGVGDFVQLRAWLMAKLLWNPQLDQSQLADEFLEGYYGEAAPFLKQYLGRVQQSFLDQNRPLTQTNADFSFLTLDVMNECTQLFDKAEAAVKNEKQLLDRVQRERLSLDIAWIYRYQKLKPEAARENKEFLGPQEPLAALQKFAQTAVRLGDNNFTSEGAFRAVLPRLEAMFAPSAPLPEFARNYPPDDVIDFQQKDFYLYRKGDISDVVEDKAASDGKAATVVGNVVDWAAQAPLNWVFEGPLKSKWRVYAFVRAGAKPGAVVDGLGMTCGIYDGAARKSLQTISPALKQVAGEQYQQIDLGVHDLDGQTYVWFAPTRNPAVERIYIDRVLLIRQR